MKNSKMFAFSLILIATGVFGGGLFAIANSINLLAAATSNEPANVMCGIILFILLVCAVVGFILLICEVSQKKEDKKESKK